MITCLLRTSTSTSSSSTTSTSTLLDSVKLPEGVLGTMAGNILAESLSIASEVIFSKEPPPALFFAPSGDRRFSCPTRDE
eukprot:g12961.t1